MTYRPSYLVVAALALAVGTLTGCGSDGNESASTATAESEACGNSTVGVLQVRTFCGDGTISITSGTTDLTLEKAECETTDAYVVVNAGTFVLAPGSVGQNEAQQLRAAREFASVTVGRYAPDSSSKPATTDGTYDAVVAFNDGEPENTITTKASATLKEGRSAGDFTGTLADGTKVSGSFTC